MDFILIRHAEAIRRAKTIYGEIDYPADTSRCENAVSLLNELSSVDVWVSSSRRRARQTAEACLSLLGRNDKVIVESGFDEQRFGVLEGMPRPENMDERYPYWLFDRDFRPAGGESFDDMSQRAFGSLKLLASRFDDDCRIAIFTHGNVMRGVLSRILKLGDDYPKSISISNLGFLTIGKLSDGFLIRL